MGNPWDNDPVVNSTDESDAPWNKDPVAEKPPVSYSGRDPLAGGVDLAAGALAGLAKTGVGIYDLAKKATDMATPSGKVSVLPPSDKAHALIDKYAPTTPAGKVGQFAEQAAEFAIPGGVVEEAMKGASLIPRVAAQAGVGAGVSAAQSGGDPGSIAMGAAGGALGPVAGTVLPGARIVSRNVENVNNPVINKALDSIANDVRMTPGQRAGQQGLQSAEKNLKNIPKTANEAHDFYQGQQSDIASKGADIVATHKGLPTLPASDAVAAGDALQNALSTRIKNGQDTAKSLYDEVRAAVAKNVKNVQTGTTTSKVLDANGNPIMTPIMSAVESPVDLDAVRRDLQPIYDDLSRKLPIDRKTSSPAYTALRDVMENGDTHMSAMDFDSFLGSLKSITRNGSSPNLSNKSQMLATQMIASGEKRLDDALASAGPNVKATLQRARDAVKGYHDTDDFLQDLRSSPQEPYKSASIFRSLLRPGDNNYERLESIAQRAPETVPVVGQTFLQELMDKATREGGWGRSAGVDATWANLGPRTKQLLFGQKGTEALNDFFIAAKALTPAQGSATADRTSAIANFGDVGKALAKVVGGAVGGGLGGAALGHGMEGAGAGAAAGAVTAANDLYNSRIYPQILARLSFKPAGAVLLRQALTLPPDSPAFQRTMQALVAMAQAGTTKRGDSPPNQRPSMDRAAGIMANPFESSRARGVMAAPPAPPGIGAPPQ